MSTPVHLDPDSVDDDSQIPSSEIPDVDASDIDVPQSTRRSGGPRTPEGKARSSQNSLQHGCCSSIVVLPDENPQDLKDLYERWNEIYQPDTDAARELLDDFVLNKWFLRRNQRRYSEVEHQLSFFTFTKWTAEQHKIYQLALRYKTAAERAAAKAQRELEDYFKNRRAEEKYSDQLDERLLKTYRQMDKDVQRHEQAIRRNLQDAEAGGIDVSAAKVQFAAQAKQNRNTFSRLLDSALALKLSGSSRHREPVSPSSEDLEPRPKEPESDNPAPFA